MNTAAIWNRRNFLSSLGALATARHYVSIPKLIETTGNRIAQVLEGLPAGHSATVTSGDAGVILCGVAGTLTGEKRERMCNFLT